MAVIAEDECNDTYGRKKMYQVILTKSLLNADINRSYKDAPFDEKRKVIIEREKSGKFIPLCTKNVFLKYYSEEVSDFDLWSEYDKAAYIEKMKSALENLFHGNWINTEKGENAL